jgi:hypothetical protein
MKIDFTALTRQSQSPQCNRYVVLTLASEYS